MHDQNQSPKYQAIIEMLRLYRDLQGGGPQGQGSGTRDGDRLLYADGGVWDKSGCDALDDGLSRLREFAPVHHWHLSERYLRCQVRPRDVRLERTHSGNFRLPKLGANVEAIGPPARKTDALAVNDAVVVVEMWSPKVRLQKVRLGVKFLAAVFPWGTVRWSDVSEPVAA